MLVKRQQATQQRQSTNPIPRTSSCSISSMLPLLSPAFAFESSDLLMNPATFRIPYSSRVRRTRLRSSSGSTFNFLLNWRFAAYNSSSLLTSFRTSDRSTRVCSLDDSLKWLWNWPTANIFKRSAFSLRRFTDSFTSHWITGNMLMKSRPWIWCGSKA